MKKAIMATTKKEELAQAKDDLEKQKLKDTVGRYKFLLGQTNLFSHFIRSKGNLPANPNPS